MRLFVGLHGEKLLRKPVAVDLASLYLTKQLSNANRLLFSRFPHDQGCAIRTLAHNLGFTSMPD